MANPFRRLFQTEEEDDQGLILANEILEAARLPYFDKLIVYLEAEADKPLTVGGQVEMIRSAERINTFREIKQKLKKDVARAKAFIEMERSDV